MKFKLLFGVFGLVMSVSPAWAVQESTINIAGLNTVVWKPDTLVPDQRYPLIIFSHGYGGCSTQSKFLTSGLADAGYIVLAPDHADAKCKARQDGAKGNLREKIQERREEAGSTNDGGIRTRVKERIKDRIMDQRGGAIENIDDPNGPNFRDEESWDDTSYVDRKDDIQKLLNAIYADASLKDLIDPNKIGIAGHSLGGYTALGLAGAWPSWKDSRVKAVLALSPFSSPYITKGTLGDMNVPVMYQGGTRDLGVTPYVKKPGGVYDLSSSPKYFVEFQGAGHFSWTNAGDEFHPAMLQYSRAFFDHYMLGQAAPILKQKLPLVSDLRYK